MGVFDKLKNVFFEEEYVEVEEPVRKPKKEKQTIAKKIDLPEMPKIKEEKTVREREIEEEVVERVEKKGISERELRSNDNNFKFPMTFEEEDFTVEEFKKPEEPKEKRTREQTKYNNFEKKYEPLTSDDGIYKSEHSGIGLYEGGEAKKETKTFKPTPIISPIYGILDKNYSKEEIVTKKEVRLTSATSKKIDLDTVREKAYGDLASDITASMMDDDVSTKEIEDESSLYDLSDDDSPVVNKVTVGDAEEYYKDLGLEYNIDYKDHAKEKATGRRSTKQKEYEEEPTVEDSLFDLIDSMYQDSEEE